jgi:hypothetical protein
VDYNAHRLLTTEIIKCVMRWKWVDKGLKGCGVSPVYFSAADAV